jgi:hypothetical protein
MRLRALSRDRPGIRNTMVLMSEYKREIPTPMKMMMRSLFIVAFSLYRTHA